jgi:O-antigen/teichoic acid export membrane protein
MSTIARDAARGAALLTAAQLCLTASSYVVAVVLARWLGPADYGVYGIVYSVLLTVELGARLGIPQAVSKLIAENPVGLPGLDATGLTLTVIVSLAVFAVFWLAAPALAAVFHVREGVHLFRIAALDIPLYSMYVMADHIVNGRRRFGLESAGIVLYSLSKLVGILFLHTLGISIAGALVVNALASAFALAFLLQRLGTSILVPTLRHCEPIFRLAVPIGMSLGAMQLLLSVDLWLLNAMGADVPETDKGLYVAAINLARMPNLLASVMFAVLIPSIAHALATDDAASAQKSARAAIRFLLALLLPGCALVAVNARELMALLFSAPYADGAPLLVLLIFAQGLSYTMFNTLGGILIACGRQGAAAGIALGVLPAAVVVNVVLIGLWGAIGAAVAALLALSAAALLAGWFAKGVLDMLLAPSVLFRTILASAPVVLLGKLIETEGLVLLLELAGLGLTYVALTVALGLLTRDDLKSFLPASAPER